MLLLVGSAEGNSKTESANKEKVTPTLLERSDIKVNRAFYHFSGEKTVTIEKKRSPTWVCTFENETLNCSREISQLINMPLLNFWPIDEKK